MDILKNLMFNFFNAIFIYGNRCQTNDKNVDISTKKQKKKIKLNTAAHFYFF